MFFEGSSKKVERSTLCAADAEEQTKRAAAMTAAARRILRLVL
jgi:hypothetical protein